MRRGLVPLAAGSVATGLDASFAAARGLWLEAVRAGLVDGEPQSALDRVVARLTGEPVRTAAVRPSQVADLVSLFERAGLGHLLALQVVQDRVFVERFERVLTKARSEAWTEAQWRSAIVELIALFAAGQQLGPLGVAFLYSTTVAPYFEIGRRALLEDETFKAIHPYLMYITQDDDRVRPNHQALNGFVARADWSGWEREAMPPHGWNCRCRMIEVSWEVARSQGWQDVFPLGIDRLASFRLMGGSDAGFPRDAFVVGALPLAA